MVNPSQARGDTLAEWRVLVLLTPSKKERTKYLVSLLEAAKARWGWQISGICEDIDRRPFAPLVEPEGKLISRPHLLRIAAWESDPEQVTDTQRRLQEAESAAGISAGRIILAGAHSAGRAYNVPFRHANR
ncbi:MAG TPA: hypothetical protein ENH27_00885, partial [Rhizobiales bacterium]|nr:hypothetical protein [Hyphomicrobiales bacterium]